MARQVTLTINDVPIKLDFYVEEFVFHIVSAIVGSLRDTGEIKDLLLRVDNGRVEITLNGAPVPLKEFPMLIITSTLDGMARHLKGVDRPLERLVAIIQQ